MRDLKTTSDTAVATDTGTVFPYLSSLLQSEGFCTTELLAASDCAELERDVHRALEGRCVSRRQPGERRAVAMLADSDLALGLLDDSRLVVRLDAAFGDDSILARLDGVVVGDDPSWRRGVEAPRQSLPSRALRPGGSLWLAIGEADQGMDVVRSSHNLTDADWVASALPQLRVASPRGHGLWIEGGVVHRPSAGSSWLLLELIRPWIKPDVFLPSALEESRLDRLGERGRRLCGLNTGLPTSVEEFLAIEEAALSGEAGQAKGSGV